MTYNIRHGRGVDGKVDLGRIADVIAAHDPDLVALQEVDAGRLRSGAVDQADRLALRLAMEPRFVPCISSHGGHYGIATLSRLPLRAHHHTALPADLGRWSEPRYALTTRVEWKGGEVELVNTHLSLRPGERLAQAVALAAALHVEDDVVVCGDLNCTPRSAPYRLLVDELREIPVRPTWPARLPVLRLDHVLYRGRLAVVHGATDGGRGARRASDHLPVVATFRAADGAPP